jgi:ubiquinone/menaquinone biosynthesis C-methylase UbiE
MATNQEHEGLAWQRGVWNRMADIYQREIDARFAPVVEHVIARGALQAGQSVLDVGTGTGVVAAQAARVDVGCGVLDHGERAPSAP